MGCDMHGHVEVRAPDDMVWEHVAALTCPRDYTVFGRLTNGLVRGDAAPTVQIEPRGVPVDASWTTRAAFTERAGDYHTTGWLTLPEYVRILADPPSVVDLPTAFRALGDYMLSFTKDAYTPRLVFWFHS